MDFIAKALKLIKKKLGSQAPGLGFLALHIVNKIQTSMPTATGKEKRDAAIQELIEAAAAGGIEAGENVARFLIESAVTVIKEKAKEIAAPKAPPSPANKPKAPKK